MKRNKTLIQGFTLIELLIVVAIIAILAAIAVPNFLEAQTRAKVSRVKADLRSMATAIEAYCVDANAYPQCNSYGTPLRGGSGAEASIEILEKISTPVAFMTSAITRDPFKVMGRYSASTALGMRVQVPTPLTSIDQIFDRNCFYYQSWHSEQRTTVRPNPPYEPLIGTARAWLLSSVGPAGNYYNIGGVLDTDRINALEYTLEMMYDATNGTVSRGALWRAGGSASPTAESAAGEGLLKAIAIANK